MTTFYTQRHHEAMREAHTAWLNFQRRKLRIESEVADKVRRQTDRFEHVKTDQDIRDIAAAQVNTDKKIEGHLGVYDRQVATATMFGIARIVELLEGGQ
jgi:hypothetical protein